jgi:hypothetical protein
MKSNANDPRHSKASGVDMSSAAIASRLREVSELHQLGLSLAKATPIQNSHLASKEKSAVPPTAIQEDPSLHTP